MGKFYAERMKKVKEIVYKTQLIREIWGDEKMGYLMDAVSWKYCYCSKCDGEFKVIKITEDEIKDGCKIRAAIVKCTKCGSEVEMGFGMPIEN